MEESRKQKLSMRQTLFPHLIRPNLSCLYYNSNSFFGRNDSTNFYDFFWHFLYKFGFKHKPCNISNSHNLHKNKQHFPQNLHYSLSRTPKIVEIGLFVSYQKTRFKNITNLHINRFRPPDHEELDERAKISISIFIAFYHTAVESGLLACFFSL